MSPHTKNNFTFGPFTFENGDTLPRVTLAYETWGELNEEKNNAILVCHALTGTSHVASGQKDSTPGWWDFLVGPDKPIDSNKFFVICANVLGGCSGSTGPSSINPISGKPYGISFPQVTIRDMVLSQK